MDMAKNISHLIPFESIDQEELVTNQQNLDESFTLLSSSDEEDDVNNKDEEDKENDETDEDKSYYERKFNNNGGKSNNNRKHKSKRHNKNFDEVKILFDKSNYNLFAFEKDNNRKNSVFDDAFREAVRRICFIVRIKLSELKIILEALNIKVHPVSEYDSRNFISLPLFHNNYISSLISAIVNQKNLIIDHSNLQFFSGMESHDNQFTISSENASLIKSQLIRLIEGSYWNIREFVLQVCNKDNMYTISDQSNGFFLVRNVCGCRIKGNSNCCGSCQQTRRKKTYHLYKYCDSSGYYYFGRPSRWPPIVVMAFLKLVLGYDPTFGLINRRKLFKQFDGQQFLLREGYSLRDMLLVGPTLLYLRLLVYQQTLRYLEFVWSSKIRPHNIFKYRIFRDLQKINQNRYLKIIKKRKDKSILIKNVRDDIFSEWGEMKKSISNSTILVEIAHFDRLVRGIYACNRAFSWGIPLNVIINLCSIIREKTGYLLSSDISKEFPSHPGRDLKWVIVKGLMINQIIVSQLSSNTSEIERLISKLYNQQHSAILIPLNCIRLINWTETYILANDIKVGSIYSVISQKELFKLYENIEWFEQPDKGTLVSAAGALVEIISIAELESHSRVGIRILSNKKCDALLIRALRYLVKDYNEKKKKKIKNKIDKDGTTKNDNNFFITEAEDFPTMNKTQPYSYNEPLNGNNAASTTDLGKVRKSFFEVEEELNIDDAVKKEHIPKNIIKVTTTTQTIGSSANQYIYLNEKSEVIDEIIPSELLPEHHLKVSKQTQTIRPQQPMIIPKSPEKKNDLTLRPPFVVKHICTCKNPCINNECKRNTSPLLRSTSPAKLTNPLFIEGVPIDSLSLPIPAKSFNKSNKYDEQSKIIDEYIRPRSPNNIVKVPTTTQTIGSAANKYIYLNEKSEVIDEILPSELLPEQPIIIPKSADKKIHDSSKRNTSPLLRSTSPTKLNNPLFIEGVPIDSLSLPKSIESLNISNKYDEQSKIIDEPIRSGRSPVRPRSVEDRSKSPKRLNSSPKGRKKLNTRQVLYEAKALDEKLTKLVNNTNSDINIILNKAFDDIKEDDHLENDWDSYAREYLESEKEKKSKEKKISNIRKVTI